MSDTWQCYLIQPAPRGTPLLEPCGDPCFIKPADGRVRFPPLCRAFPEGTRTKTGRMGKFKGGTFSMSTKTGAPIIPISIVGTFAMFPPEVLLPLRPTRNLEIHVHPQVRALEEQRAEPPLLGLCSFSSTVYVTCLLHLTLRSTPRARRRRSSPRCAERPSSPSCRPSANERPRASGLHAQRNDTRLHPD